MITLTKAGKDLQDKALGVPECLANELNLTPAEAAELYRILYKILRTVE